MLDNGRGEDTRIVAFGSRGKGTWLTDLSQKPPSFGALELAGEQGTVCWDACKGH